MINVIDFTHHGEREFNKLPHQVQKRINGKLKLFLVSGTALFFAKPLINFPPSTHRFRVGKYRICFYVEGNAIVIDSIDTRADAYRRR